jgi:hypothetical protein
LKLRAGQVAESNRRATRLGEGGMNLSRIEEEEGGLGTLAPTPYRFHHGGNLFDQQFFFFFFFEKEKKKK